MSPHRLPLPPPAAINDPSRAPPPVVVLGASGEVGRQAVLHALRSASAARVYSVGRSETPNVYPLTPGFDKLVHVPLDYDRLHAGDAVEAGKLAELDADVVLSAFGTSKARAGGAEQFIRIDREYALAAAKATRVEGKEQTLVYCSVSRPGCWSARRGYGKLTNARCSRPRRIRHLRCSTSKAKESLRKAWPRSATPGQSSYDRRR